MKAKKKVRKSTGSVTLLLSDSERTALTQALLFLLHCRGFSYETNGIAQSSVESALDKLESSESVLSRSQLRACVTAVKESIFRMSGDPEGYADVLQDFPDLIPDIRESLPLLTQLLPRLRAKLV